MSIIKSILHKYNATSKAYDTLHPETESAQITDWHSGIIASLASKTLGTVVDAITTDSVLGKLIKMLLNASGVKYLIDTNGYICFGEYFGGLIIQWICVTLQNAPADYALPITMEKPISAVANDGGGLCTSIGIMPQKTSATIIARQTILNITVQQFMQLFWVHYDCLQIAI